MNKISVKENTKNSKAVLRERHQQVHETLTKAADMRNDRTVLRERHQQVHETLTKAADMRNDRTCN